MQHAARQIAIILHLEINILWCCLYQYIIYEMLGEVKLFIQQIQCTITYYQ